MKGIGAGFGLGLSEEIRACNAENRRGRLGLYKEITALNHRDGME